MKLLLSSAVLLLWVASLAAQEETAEVDPIVVTGTLELRQAPPPADSFMRFFEKQVEAKKAEQDALGQSPFWNARFWSLIPMRLESSMDAMDPSRFSIPNYATIEYREAARYMNELQKHSIFDQ